MRRVAGLTARTQGVSGCFLASITMTKQDRTIVVLILEQNWDVNLFGSFLLPLNLHRIINFLYLTGKLHSTIYLALDRRGCASNLACTRELVLKITSKGLNASVNGDKSLIQNKSRKQLQKYAPHNSVTFVQVGMNIFYISLDPVDLLCG